MTREKDFEKAAMDFCEDHSHCIYFEAGAEYGYKFAKKRLSEVLGFELDFNVAEFDDGVTTESLVDKICKRMED